MSKPPGRVRPILALALLLLGCQAPGTPVGPGAAGGAGSAGRPRPTLAKVAVVGVVAAPGYLLSNGGARLRPGGEAGGTSRGATLISDQGGGVVSNNGSQALASDGARYRLQAADDQPLKGVKVFLADAAGQPVPDVPAVRTDAQGRYRLEGVAANAGYVVVSEVPMGTGKTGQLRTLVKVGAAGVTAPIGPATTLVTLNVLEGAAGSDLVDVNPATFQSAVDVTARSLTPERVPDFADRASVKRAIDQLVVEVAELRGILGEIRKELASPDQKHASGGSPGAVGPSLAPGEPRPPISATAIPPEVSRGAGAAPSSPAATFVGVVSTLAGSGAVGFTDGPGAAASFNDPTGVAVDANGSVYVADRANNLIRKVTPQGVVSTFAGNGTKGFADGPGAVAQFNGPSSLAIDASGNVYVGEVSSHRIRKITPQGLVSTIAGSGAWGFADGQGEEAQFNGPYGVAVDGSGNLFVADYYNHRIRKITPQGVVSTLAGSGAGGITGGFADGPGAEASFSGPMGVAVDASGHVYVAETRCRIRVISPQGMVSTFAGSGTTGFVDGPGVTAQFSDLYGVAVDAGGHVYVVDNGNNAIRKVTPEGEVSTLAGTGTGGFTDGPGVVAQFSYPYGVAVDASGRVYVADRNNNRIRVIR
ncbi:MAG: NHL repeat-containing protein [Candidatus Sericytochromatia bacterium]|nr:NHL repeat-containing protein [Candidatus Sericytochromatia bacterium]